MNPSRDRPGASGTEAASAVLAVHGIPASPEELSALAPRIAAAEADRRVLGEAAARWPR